jgi:hypothetical protein
VIDNLEIEHFRFATNFSGNYEDAVQISFLRLECNENLKDGINVSFGGIVTNQIL